jgi:hypothetical protein
MKPLAWFAIMFTITSIIILTHKIDNTASLVVEACKAGKSLTVNGVEIHCGIISPYVNKKAAKHRAIVSCNNLIREFENGN